MREPAISPAELMRLALDKGRQGVDAGQSPFGCAIAIGDRVVAVTHNTVLAANDITAHAEINALRAACAETGDILLEGAIVASTCEPCPMCMSALHWARVERVYFGAGIADAGAAGFNELTLHAERLLQLGGSRVELKPGLMRDECVGLFEYWASLPGHRAY